ncbi:MAG: hypothetical protein GF364_07720 [Candidatus Lokiarchaeota archaeon]|nr:hypothetical protein [Candidatus Lokiarchaeota archaeon]
MNMFNSSKRIKFVSLLSDGIDSPIATYLMMKKEFDCIALTFCNIQDEAPKYQDKILKIARKIKTLTQKKISVVFAQHTETLDYFIKKGSRKLTCIMCKRYMLRAARLLAIEKQASFIVNGDILGEQASQTLDNLVEIQNIVDDIPIIRPLIGFEKLDVIHLSQDVGLFPLSSLPAPSCNYYPRYPETHAKTKDILNSELNINYDKIASKILSKSKLIEI